ncbi:pyocin activator PrtN family protein [Citrobacter werkmanii]|nr:pyocin activator PrtN family protein [Citrobacter werkmanii]MDO8234454.1 pyocin activator PrtN family protein [Citrobacter werkmanii]
MFLLMAEYETPAVALSEICEKYLGIPPRHILGVVQQSGCEL